MKFSYTRLNMVIVTAVLIVMSFQASNLFAKIITLEQAVEIAVNQTSRGDMIRANLEVAEQNYFARRINYYLPEISINASTPAYSVDESYRLFGGSPQKKLYKTQDIGLNSFIELKQTLITGGDIRATANFLAREEKYPNTRFEAPENSFIDEITKRGFFAISYTQPILKPSASKNNLHNMRNNYNIAKLEKVAQEAALKKEVVESYIGALQMDLKNELYSDMYESAGLRANIDSVKFIEEILSEEKWLLSTSNRLDAELNRFDIEMQTNEIRRNLAILLDHDPAEKLKLSEPENIRHIDEAQKKTMLSAWEFSIPVKKAELEYSQAKREADYKSSGHGLTGDLTANYSTGRGNVEVDGITDNINTKGWGVSLNFSYPLWDGGSSGAEVKSAKIQAQQAKLEYERTKQNTKAEITSLLHQLNVSYRRLEIIKKQIELALNRLQIAESRYLDGQISRIKYLDGNGFYLETKIQYLDELKSYLLNLIEVEAMFVAE